jgi:hypothetical protein
MIQGRVLIFEENMTNQLLAIFLPCLRGGGAERAMATFANGFTGSAVFAST